MTRHRHLLVAGFIILFLVGTWAWYTRDRTIYADGFHEASFRKVAPGMSQASVVELLGQPLLEEADPFPETWLYREPIPAGESRTFRIFEPSESVSFEPSGRIAGVKGIHLERLQGADDRDDVLRVLGPPRRKVAARTKSVHYSRPSAFGLYRARIVTYTSDDLVAEVFAYDTYD